MQNGVRIIHMDFKHWCTTCNCHVAADEDSAAFSWSLASLENKLSTITSKLNYSNRVHVLSYIPAVNSRNMNRAAACFCVWRRSRYLVSDFNLDPISVTGEEGQSPNVSSVTQHIYLLNTRSSIQTLWHTLKKKKKTSLCFSWLYWKDRKQLEKEWRPAGPRVGSDQNPVHSLCTEPPESTNVLFNL